MKKRHGWTAVSEDEKTWVQLRYNATKSKWQVKAQLGTVTRKNQYFDKKKEAERFANKLKKQI